jgi:TRAP-type C4-dicarboxylate transport system permease small subunit
MTQAQCKFIEETEYEAPVSTVRVATNPFDKIVTRTFAVICFVMAILLAVIISAATVMRYILEMDLYGYEEWIKIFAFWLYFM